MIPRGYCQCGCGQKTKPASMTSRRKGHVKGEPMRFIAGHNSRVDNPNRIKSPRPKLNPSGLCRCGCGEPAPIAKKSDRKRGYVKGEPMLFRPNHHGRLRAPAVGTRRRRLGYVEIYDPGHPNAFKSGWVAEHTVVVSRALGKAVPAGAHVHHVNEDRADNRPANLVLCDPAFHRLLHQRTDALNACGNADWRKCTYCKAYDDPAQMKEEAAGGVFYHQRCKSAACHHTDVTPAIRRVG